MKIKKLISLILAIVMLLTLIPNTIGVFAATSGSCGTSATWSYDSATKTLTISGSGAMTDYTASSNAPWYDLRGEITSISIGENITSLGRYSFYNCTALTSVSIPENITSVNGGAFRGCTALETVNLNENVTTIVERAFEGCTSLVHIDLPDAVTTIGWSAFSGCTKLEEIHYGENITSVGENAFSNTVWYNSFADGVVYVGKVAYKYKGNCNGKVILNPGTVSISGYAFDGMKSMTSIFIPEGVVSIGSYAFRSCTALKSVSLPNSLKSLGTYAFQSCTGIPNIIIPENVTAISQAAFYGCSGLKWVDMKCKSANIANQAFFGCSKLIDVSIPAGISNISSSAFSGCYALVDFVVDEANTKYSTIDGVLFNKDATALVLYPAGRANSYTVPAGVKEIKGSAFYLCTKLTDVILPDGLTTIAASAFSGCSGLTTVTIPSSVKTIAYYAFGSCTALELVNYKGSSTQWSAISFADGNTYLTNAPKTYNYNHSHLFGGFTTTVTPTCSTAGSKWRKCATCGYIQTVTLSLTEHNYSAVVTEPDCQNQGYTTYTCSVCNDSYIADYVDTIGHKYDNDCDTDCNVCGEVREIQHNYVPTVTSPDCTNGGYTTYTCSVCGDSYVADETEALGHKYDNDCDTDCNVCGEVREIKHNYVPTVTSPDCINGGYTTYTCSVCGDSYVADETEALGHKYDNDCDIDCNVCGEVREIKHNYVPTVTSPDCTNGGYTTYTCSVCGDSYVADETEALGHKYDNDCDTDCNVCGATREIQHSYVENVVEPTCTEGGYTRHVCSVCNDEYTDNHVDALGHNMNSDGICDVCGASDNLAPGDLNGDGSFNAGDLVGIKHVLIYKNYDEDVVDASDCNGDYESDLKDMVRLKKHVANDVGSAPFTYEINENGEAVITGFDGSVNGAVTIPSNIDGYTVTAIGDGAFENCTGITSILIPNTVVKIGDNAFAGCENLNGTAIPNNITLIGSYAFSSCKSMMTVRLSKNIEEIGEAAFLDCSSLIEINIPEKVTVLNNSAFKGCSSLVFVGLPENLKEIKTYTFYGCSKLESVSIPITVVEVGNNAFDSCESLLSVVVPYETAFGENVFSNCSKLTVKGYAGTGGIDAAVNSGANYELMECGHSEFVLLYAVNPTCEEVGYSGDKYCVSCGKIEVKGIELPKTAHATELRLFKEVTCTEDGYTGDIVCTLCNLRLEKGEVVEATGHYAEGMEELEGYVAATCTEKGCYGQFTCEKCNQNIDNEAIPAKGHKTYYKDKKYASCVEDGYTGDLTCYVCDTQLETGKVIAKGNHNYFRYDYKEATCTEDGYSGDWKCIGCDKVASQGEVLPKGHVAVTENYKAATCTENGYSGDSQCSRCGESLSKGEVLPLLGHMSVLINYSEVTCTEDGYTGDQYCSRCEVLVTIGKTVEKLGHNLVLKNQKDCTATEAGYTGDWVCERCNEIVEKGNVIPANHQHTMDTVGYKEATCTEEGYTGDSTCTVCGYYTEGSVIPKKPHEITTTVKNPTCSEGGYTIDECINCDYEKKYNEVDALGHDWDAEWTVDKSATCTEEGSQHKNCSRCDEKQIETIKAKGHTEGELVNAKAPTCTEEGYTGDYTCTVCGREIVGEVIAKTGHNFSEWVLRCIHQLGTYGEVEAELADTFEETIITTDYAENYRICESCQYEETYIVASGKAMYEITETSADCENDGAKIFGCNHCEAFYTLKFPALGHDCTSETTAPTCTEQGYTTYTCSRCETSYKDNFVDALGHDWDAEWTVDKSATCTEEGSQHKNCSRCDEKLAETVEAIGHTMGEPQNVKAPTCSEEGYTGDTTCAVCGEVTYGTSIPAKEHNYSEWETRCFHKNNLDDPAGGMGDDMMDGGMMDGDVYDDLLAEEYAEEYRICVDCQYEETNRLATERELYSENPIYGSCTSEGSITYSCNYCDYSYTDILSAPGHNYYFEITDPTCTEQGYTTYTCYNCSDSYISDYVDALGHNWNSDTGYCNTCDIECDHIPDEAGGMCAVCGRTPCPNCGAFDHIDCTGTGGGMYCGACGGTDHMDGDPMCPMICCELCGQTGHIGGAPECPMNGFIVCDICGNYGHEYTECPMMMG